MSKESIKERLKKEIDRQREYGFSGTGVMADALRTIEMLEQAHTKPLPNDPEKPAVKSKGIADLDILIQLKRMSEACSVQMPNEAWSAHPVQVCLRAANEIRRLRHDLDLLREENGGCNCGAFSYPPGTEPRGSTVDMGAETGEEDTGRDGDNLR